MHWPAPGVASISRKSAFISSGFSARPDAHRVPAGEGPEPTIEPARKALRAVLRREVGGEIAHEAGKIALSDRRGRFAHQDRAGAEALDDKAEPRQLLVHARR